MIIKKTKKDILKKDELISYIYNSTNLVSSQIANIKDEITRLKQLHENDVECIKRQLYRIYIDID